MGEHESELLALRPPWPTLRRPFGAGHDRPSARASLQLPHGKRPANTQPNRSRNKRLQAKIEIVEEHGAGRSRRSEVGEEFGDFAPRTLGTPRKSPKGRLLPFPGQAAALGHRLASCRTKAHFCQRQPISDSGSCPRVFLLTPRERSRQEHNPFIIRGTSAGLQKKEKSPELRRPVRSTVLRQIASARPHAHVLRPMCRSARVDGR